MILNIYSCIYFHQCILYPLHEDIGMGKFLLNKYYVEKLVVEALIYFHVSVGQIDQKINNAYVGIR